MKKLLFLVVMGLTVSACDIVERTSMGDDLLTVLHNKSKGTKTIMYQNEVLLKGYNDFRLVDYAQRETYFIAAKDDGEELYYFTNQPWEALTKYYSAKHIEYGDANDGGLFVGTLADGRQEVYRIYKNLVTGPYDKVYPMMTGFIYEKNGLCGMQATDGTEYVAPKYEKIYAIGFYGIRYCTYKGGGMYDVNKLMIRMVNRKEQYFLSKCGTISQQDIDELRKYAIEELSEYSFVANYDKKVVPKDLFNRADKNFNSK